RSRPPCRSSRPDLESDGPRSGATVEGGAESGDEIRGDPANLRGARREGARRDLRDDEERATGTPHGAGRPAHRAQPCAHRGPGRPEPDSRDLSIPGVRARGRAHGVRPQHPRALSPRRRLRGEDPQGRQARRPARGAANQVRPRDQPQDGEGPRAVHSPPRARSRRRAAPRTTRRVFLGTLVGGAIAASSAARAQSPAKVPRIGVLGDTSPPAESRGPSDAAFSDGLRELGYVEERNVTLEYRYAEGKREALPGLAAHLARPGADAVGA